MLIPMRRYLMSGGMEITEIHYVPAGMPAQWPDLPLVIVKRSASLCFNKGQDAKRLMKTRTATETNTS